MALLHANSAVFRQLLVLYPRELRERFGDEMVLVFGEQITEAWRAARVTGLVRIWLRAIWELATIAVPQRVFAPAVFAGAVSLIAASAVFLALLRALAPVSVSCVK